MAESRGADLMAALIPVSFPALPAMVANSGGRAGVRFIEFFTARIRNPHTRAGPCGPGPKPRGDQHYAVHSG